MQFRSLLERSQTRSERHATERMRIGEEGLKQPDVEQQIPRSRERRLGTAKLLTKLITCTRDVPQLFPPWWIETLLQDFTKSHHIFSSSRIIKGLNNSIDRNDGKTRSVVDPCIEKTMRGTLLLHGTGCWILNMHSHFPFLEYETAARTK